MPLDLPDGWRDQLPEDIRASASLDTITTIDQMATMVVNARKMQANHITVPSADASKEVRDTFLSDLQGKIPDLVYVGEGADLSALYGRMGRPKTAAEYKLGDIPDPLKGNFAKLSETAHGLGVTDAQLKGISESIVGDYTESMNLAAGKSEANKAAVVALFGEAAPEKMTATAEFAKKIGFDDNLVSAIRDGNVGVDNMKAFDQVMQGYESSGPRIGDDLGKEFDHLTPQQAELQLAEIMDNKKHPFWDGGNAAHDAAVQKVVELTRAADAGKELSENDKFREALQGGGG